MERTARRTAYGWMGLAFATVAGAPVATAADKDVASAPRFACVETATEAELHIDLGAGENGVWRGELTLTILGGTSELGGSAHDMSKLGTKGGKPPQVRLKPKPINDAQRAELLRDLAEAVRRSDDTVECDKPVPQNVKLAWSCTNGSMKTAGDQSYEGDRCAKAKTHGRAVAVADWAVAVLKRLGGR